MTTISTRPDTSSQEPFTESSTHKIFFSAIPQDSTKLEQSPSVKFSQTLLVVLILIFAIAIVAASSITLYLLIYKCRINQQLRQALMLRPLPQRHSGGYALPFEDQEDYEILPTAGLPNQPGLGEPLDVGSVIRPTGASESRQDTAYYAGPDYAIASATNTIPYNSSGGSHPSPLPVGKPTTLQVHPTERIHSQVRVQLVIKLSSRFLTGYHLQTLR